MPDLDKALELIFRGYRYRDDQSELLDERMLVSDFFNKITAKDVEYAIAEFEHSTEQSEREKATKALIAYFRWCWREGRSQIGKTSLNDLVVAFAKASFLRIAGAKLVSGDKDDGDFLPRWRRPDVVFGIAKPNHPLPKNYETRDITIALHVEYLRREGYETVNAKKAAVKKYKVGLDVVMKAMTFGNKLFGKRAQRMSNDDLNKCLEYLNKCLK